MISKLTIEKFLDLSASNRPTKRLLLIQPTAITTPSRKSSFRCFSYAPDDVRDIACVWQRWQRLRLGGQARCYRSSASDWEESMSPDTFS
jgi:hypothetical protein